MTSPPSPTPSLPPSSLPPSLPPSFLPPSAAVKSGLSASAAFMILAILATFLAVILFFPLWHWFFYVIGACVAILSGMWGPLTVNLVQDQYRIYTLTFSQWINFRLLLELVCICENLWVTGLRTRHATYSRKLKL